MKNPKLIVKPFAKNGQKNVIPENYETSMESNQATWDQGFGQITMLPVAAGGFPPKGQDFNGIFNQISENIVYLSQGGRFKFSAEYAEAIGGYPKGAILQSDDEKKEYLSLIDNNKVDFNTVTDISASWKLVNTDDLLAQIASKQPKGDYATKTELNSGLAGKQPVGDYATKEDVDKKLDKSKVTNSLINSRELVPTTALLIDNLALKQPIGDYQQAGYSYSKAESDNKYQPKGDYATNAALNKIIPPKGMVSFFLHRENALPAGWYSLNGDRYSADSFAGKALRSLPEEIKSDWGIIDSGTTITTPNLRQSDGRLPFIRPSNSKGTAPGVVSGDTMRNINGEIGYDSQYGLTTGDNDVSGAFYRFGPSRKSLMGGGSSQTTNIAFSADRVVPTGAEFKPLSIDMVVAVYLGVA
ncbi:hypothetical protein ISO55_00235 [Morganella morganii subsp. morganii]|uniref:hypothetical protein n=1 Tax=Morganella morganii TaxID=582 RepID=UPI001BD9EE8C|nr:hypothetical protein [Morganella morganii]MBT0365404.1 hypothetical protein [Morganella morganii subsp. morganii]